MAKQRYLFISYARTDHDRVLPLVDAVREQFERRALPIEVWMDLSNLRPGENWQGVITDALTSSVGFLVFASPQSLRSKWIEHEIKVAAGTGDRLVIPVFLQKDLTGVPLVLMQRQGIDLSGAVTREQLLSAATKVADAVERYLESDRLPRSMVRKTEALAIATDLADEFRSRTRSTKSGEPPKSVFVVTGHSDKTLAELEGFLTSVGVEPIVLSRKGASAQSLFQKFVSVASKAEFAVVILSSDDYGASRRQYDTAGVGERCLQFRARQNVVLELGFFYGQLGWENVFVLYEDPDKVFPNFERPSDLDGVVFDSLSDSAWQRNLADTLLKAGFELPLST